MVTALALLVVFLVVATPGGEAHAEGVADFTIQGVSTGDSTKEAGATLIGRGYTTSQGLIFKIPQPAADPLAALGYTTDETVQPKTISLRDFEGTVERVVMAQYFGKNDKVDPDVILGQIVGVVGPPMHESTFGEKSEYTFSDFPSAPGHMEAGEACNKAYNPSVPANLHGRGNQLMRLEGWVRAGETEVEEFCPGAMEVFRRYIEAQLAPKLILTVTPGQVTLDLFESGIRARKQRAVQAENAKKAAEREKAPPVQIDF
jgi:hypothetical protein